MAQSSNGNTNHSRQRVRHFCFTLNNYTEAEITNLCHALSEGYYVFQKETGKNGTPHLQGFVSYKNPRTINGMKRINRRIHWEAARNINAAKDYCWKEDTADGDIYSNFDYKHQMAQSTGTNFIKKCVRPSDEEIQKIIKKSIEEMDDSHLDDTVYKYITLVHPYLDKE